MLNFPPKRFNCPAMGNLNIPLNRFNYITMVLNIAPKRLNYPTMGLNISIILRIGSVKQVFLI